MKKILLSTFSISLFVGLGVSVPSGCSDGDGQCAEECGNNPAWRCPLGLGQDPRDFCGDKTMAQLSCDQAGGGEVFQVPSCESGGGTGGQPGADGSDPSASEEGLDETASNADWEPANHITVDPSSGDVSIDADWFQELRDDPSPLLTDGTMVDPNHRGYLTVTQQGLLGDALGLQVGDVLLSLNGQSMHGDAIWDTIGALQEDTSFTLRYWRPDGDGGQGRDATLQVSID